MNRAECSLKGFYMPPILSENIGGITTPTTPRHNTGLLPPFLHSIQNGNMKATGMESPIRVLVGSAHVWTNTHWIRILRTSRTADRPKAVYLPDRGCRGLRSRRIRRCSSEQRRMAVVKLGEDALHGGFTKDCGALFDTEAVTVLFHDGQFLIVQVDDLTMSAPERSLAHLYVFRIGNRRVLLFLCQTAYL